MSRVRRVFVVVAIAVAVGLATAVSPFASSSPDGLERVAEDKGSPGDGQRTPSRRTRRSRTTPSRASTTRALATGVAGFAGSLVRCSRAGA